VQEVVEAAAGDQRGRGRDRRPHLAPQVGAQQAAGVERAGVGTEGDQAILDAGLEPLGQRRLAVHRGLQPELGRGRHVLQARRKRADAAVELGAARCVTGVVARQHLELGRDQLELLEQRPGAAGNLAHGLGPVGRQHAAFEPFGGIGHVELEARPAVAAVARAHAALLARERQPLGRLGQPRHRAPRQFGLRGLELARQRRHVHAQRVGDGARHVGHGARQLVQPAAAHQVHALGELALGHCPEVVRLVEHQVAVGRVGQRVQTQGGQQQVVVDHDHLRLRQLRARAVVAAAVVAGAVACGAGVALGRHRGPDIAFGRFGQAVAVAVPVAAVEHLAPALVDPAALGPDPLQRVALGLVAGLVAEQVRGRRVAAGHLVQLEAAHITAPPLGQREHEGLGQHRRQRRQVLGDQLFLQRHGGGRDHHPLALRQRQRDHGRGVGGRLAHAGAGLHHRNGARAGWRRVFALLGFGGPVDHAQGLGNVRRHLALTGARTKAIEPRDHVVKSTQRQGFARQRSGGSVGRFVGQGHRARKKGTRLSPTARRPHAGRLPAAVAPSRPDQPPKEREQCGHWACLWRASWP
jgi:hypothetical protein